MLCRNSAFVLACQSGKHGCSVWDAWIPWWLLVAAPPKSWACPGTQHPSCRLAAQGNPNLPVVATERGMVVLTQLQDKCAIRAYSVLKSNLKSFPYSFKLAIDSFYKMPCDTVN